MNGLKSEQEATWIASAENIAERLYELEAGDTFAVKISKSWGDMIRHITVSEGPYPDSHNYSQTTLAEPYDVVLRGDDRRHPSADIVETQTISHDPDDGTVYIKQGPGLVDEVDAITTDTIAVNYESDVDLVAECECGQTTRIPVSEADLPMMGQGMIETDDGFVTPCCRSQNWVTTLD